VKIQVDEDNESWLRSKGKKGEKPEKGKPSKGDSKSKKPKKADDASLAIRVAARVLRSRGV
jgi:hypothetical protein